VRIGIVGTDLTQVTAGIAPGATVIVNPPAGLKPGTRVIAATGR
jgi:hypothetical protein